MTPEQFETNYPGVITAYEFVRPSYDWMLARFEAADNRLRLLQAFAVTATTALLGAFKTANPNLQFTDWRFVVAALLFAALMGVGCFGWLRGGVMLANPRIFQEKWLRYREWEFKKNAVFWSAEHFRLNDQQIKNKSRLTAYMLALLLLELGLLFAWFATGRAI